MLTKRGWRLLAVAVGLAAAGRVLGMVELFGLAAAAGALLVGAIVYVQVRRPRLGLRRTLHPGRVAAGGATVVELVLANDGLRRSPLVESSDGAVQALAGPLRPGESGWWRYGLPAPYRGIVPVGPAVVRLTDPFGLAARTIPGLAPSLLVVHPRSEVLVPPPRPGGRPGSGPAMGARPLVDLAELSTLRPYQPGDDLRRVHWPTVARVDELVVRHDESPAPWHCVVVLDLRAPSHDALTAEEAVSAAASLVRGCADDDGLVRLVTTGGYDSGLGGGASHVEAVLDALAGAGADATPGLGRVGATVGPSPDARTLVVVSGAGLGPADVAALGPARGPADMLVAVRLLPAGVPPATLLVDRLVDVPWGTPFGRVWNATFTGVLVPR